MGAQSSGHEYRGDWPEPDRCTTTVGGHPSGMPMRCYGRADHTGAHYHPACVQQVPGQPGEQDTAEETL